jgi:hypothetical protein
MKKIGSLKEFERVCQWRDAAIADGWEATPTYGESESIERACRLEHPDGFVAQIITRFDENPCYGVKWRANSTISIWGPDRLAIKEPYKYNMGEIKANLRLCDYCKEYVEETVRVGFANRSCKKCAPEMIKKIEVPGWCN